MPKYVTLEWNEYNRLRDDLRTLERKTGDDAWLRNQLIPLVVKPEDEQYYKGVLGPLPPEGWKPVTDEQIIERIKEKFSGK